VASAAPEAARLGLDAVTAATPLAVLKGFAFRGDTAAALQYARDNLAPAFLGNVGGCVGETSALALLLGAAWLFLRGHLTWHIPLPMLATVFGLTFALTTSITMALFNLVAGGLILGAFFMATDMVTTPVTRLGRILFGVGCGFLVVLIRQFGAYPEGVCYSILIMNSVTPLLDTWTRPRIFGEAKAHA
jgi:electron transport complex protein RnfD